MNRKIIAVLALIACIILIIAGFYVVYNPSSDKEEENDSNGNQQNNGDDPSSNENEEPPETNAGPWPMYLFGPDHQSFTTESGPETKDLLWSEATGGITYGSAIVAEGKVFIGGGDGMNAYYENNGTLAWRFETYEPVPGGYGISSTPAYSNGFVYFGGDGIYCLSPDDGTVEWFVDTPAQNWGDGTPTVANGNVYIGGSDRKLYSIDQYTGEVHWTFQTQSSGQSNYGLYAAPAVANGYVYLSACDSNLYKIREIQSSEVAVAQNTFQMAFASYSAPVIVDDRVFVGCGYTDTNIVNRFYCLDESDLSLIWAFNPTAPSSFFSSAGYYNNRIYIGSLDGNLYCFDSDGNLPTIIDQYDLGSTWSSPAITSERMYIGSKEGYVYCFDLSTTQALSYLWQYDTSGNVDSTPAISGGRLYIGSHGNGGSVFCLGS
ncbi:MAG: PQQ-binding-like beta-propeller repeat protein [Thermoplasmata archaeon]|nr:MAG: PQQ-binding-like beta-propeller repeat protein [Thermoplasmata archaeon]